MPVSPKAVFNTFMMSASKTPSVRCPTPIEMMTMLVAVENIYKGHTGRDLYDEPCCHTNPLAGKMPYYESIKNHLDKSDYKNGQLTEFIRNENGDVEIIDIYKSHDAEMTQSIGIVWNDFMNINKSWHSL